MEDWRIGRNIRSFKAVINVHSLDLKLTAFAKPTIAQLLPLLKSKYEGKCFDKSKQSLEITAVRELKKKEQGRVMRHHLGAATSALNMV